MFDTDKHMKNVNEKWLQWTIEHYLQLVSMNDASRLSGSIVIYGVGDYVYKAFKTLVCHGYKIDGVCDDKIEKRGELFYDCPIISADDLLVKYSGKELSLIIAINDELIREKIYGQYIDEEYWNFYYMKPAGFILK